LTVTPRCSPLFTVMLVHRWYMKPPHRSTTLRGRNFGAAREKRPSRHSSMPQEYRRRTPISSPTTPGLSGSNAWDYAVLGLGRSAVRELERRPGYGADVMEWVDAEHPACIDWVNGLPVGPLQGPDRQRSYASSMSPPRVGPNPQASM
jgi:hypothetical protein